MNESYETVFKNENKSEILLVKSGCSFQSLILSGPAMVECQKHLEDLKGANNFFSTTTVWAKTRLSRL
jgi:hypothetical protein